MKCFILMPFASEFDDVYAIICSAVRTAVAGVEVKCQRLDDERPAGRITDRLIQALTDATVCIADVTGLNANVMWEVGFAMAKSKPVLLLCQGEQKLPFDLHDMQTVFYDRKALAATLQTQLAESFRATLSVYQSRAAARTLPASPTGRLGLTIAVTGSMLARANSLRTHIPSTLGPYLNKSARWLVGSWGTSDEETIEFLASHEQNVVVVGYSEADISPAVLALMERHSIPFVAGNLEKGLRGLSTAPSVRDAFMLSRSDLAVMLWDGQSKGTQQLINWYQQQGRDFIVSFV